MSLLEELIGEDYKVIGSDGRWAKTEEHSSLVIDREKDIFFWNSKGIVGDAFIYLTKVRGMPVHAAREFLRAKDYKATYIFTFTDKADVVALPELVTIFWENGKDNREYWYHRGLTDDTINRFQLGYYEGWYTLPIFIDNTFRNFQLRKDNPKTIRPWYRGVGPLLFNADIMKLTDIIYITEGPVDAILLNQYGIPAISHTAGADGWNKEWFKYFINQKKIYLVYDNDDAGRNGAKKVAKELGVYRTKIYTFEGLKDKCDVVEYFRSNLGDQDDLKIDIRDRSKFEFEIGDKK